MLRRRAHGWNAFGVDNPATLDALLAAAQRRGVPEDSVRARFDAVPDTLVADLAISPQSILTAATYGRGVFRVLLPTP